MDPQLEQAIAEAERWAELCRLENVPAAPLEKIVRQAQRSVPMVLALLIAGNGQELINFLWGPA
jgi:hypothetical protein